MVGSSPMFPSSKTSQVGTYSVIHFRSKNSAPHQESNRLRKRILNKFPTGTHLQRGKKRKINKIDHSSIIFNELILETDKQQ